MGANLLIETLKQIEEGTAPREKQGDDFTLAPMLKKEMAKIDWENKNAVEIKNLVRGLNPIIGAYTFLNDKKIKFWRVEVSDKYDYKNYEEQKNGTVIGVDNKERNIHKSKRRNT